MIELVAKMYVYRKVDKKLEDKRCKGTKKCAVDEIFTFDHYNVFLLHDKKYCREQILFMNKKNKVYTVNKIALNRDKNKRRVQADGSISKRKFDLIQA